MTEERRGGDRGEERKRGWHRRAESDDRGEEGGRQRRGEKEGVTEERGEG